MELEPNILIIGNRNYHINEDLTFPKCYVSDTLISDVKNQIIESGNLLGYGILKSSVLYDFDIGMIGFLNYNVKSMTSRIRNSSESSHEYNYDYIVNEVIGLLDYEKVMNRLIKTIQEFYCTSKNLYMVRNYGIIYSNNKNKSTPMHIHNCDIVINICLHSDLELRDFGGMLCYYTSQPSIISKLKKNIRITLPMETGDMIIHRGTHSNQVFPINPNSSEYRTHLIIECNFF